MHARQGDVRVPGIFLAFAVLAFPSGPEVACAKLAFGDNQVVGFVRARFIMIAKLNMVSMDRERLDLTQVSVASWVVSEVADNHDRFSFLFLRPSQRGLDGDPKTARGSEAAGHATGRGITRTARSAAQEVRGYPVRGPKD